MCAVDYFHFGRHLGRRDGRGDGALHVRDVFGVCLREKSRRDFPLCLRFSRFGAGGVCAGTFDSAVGIFVYDFRVIFLGFVAAENAGA